MRFFKEHPISEAIAKLVLERVLKAAAHGLKILRFPDANLTQQSSLKNAQFLAPNKSLITSPGTSWTRFDTHVWAHGFLSCAAFGEICTKGSMLASMKGFERPPLMLLIG